MKTKFLSALTVVLLFLMPNFNFGQTAPNLGVSSSYALFTGSGASFANSGATIVTGDIGSNASIITGFPSPGTVIGATHSMDLISGQVATAVGTAYSDLTQSGSVLGVLLVNGQTITKGVWSTGAAATLNGTITLDGENDPNAIFIIRIGGAFAVAPSSKVILTRSASLCNVYWQVDGEFSLGASADFKGTLIATGAIHLLEGSTLEGRAFSTAGAIDLHNNIVSVSSVPATPGAITGIVAECPAMTGQIYSIIAVPNATTYTWTVPTGWSIISGAGTISINITTGTVGQNGNITVTAGNACGTSSAKSLAVTVNPLPIAPLVGTITQPTCALATGSVHLTGLPAGSWTINPGAIAGSTASTTISGLSAAIYNYTVTNAAGCTSVASANIVINAQPLTPTAPVVGTITQPTCAVATGSVVLSGLPTGNWIINPGSISGSTASTTISGLSAAIYNYTVTNAAGCTSAASANVVINAQPATPTAPVVGTITQPTCAVATGSVVLSGLPIGNWTINPGSITGSTTSTTISGLSEATYNYTVTNAAGCISVESADVVINAQPETPTAPVIGTKTQPTCAIATGSVVLSGLPVGSWTINPGAIVGNTTSKTISGITSGTHNFTVTNAVGCTSVASANVVINAQPSTLSVANQTTTIISGGTFTITPSGVPVGTTYTWIAPTYTGGVTGGSAQPIPQTNISDMLTIPSGTGTAIYSVTPTSGSCVGAPFTVTVTVNISCVPVTIGTQPTDNSMCMISGDTSFTVSANGTAPFIYQWQYNNAGTWANVVNGTPAGSIYSNQNTEILDVAGITANGSYQYRIYITNCAGANNATSNIATLTVNILPTAPLVGTIIQPTCTVATGSVHLTGLPTGNWIINPNTIIGSTVSTTISGIAKGTYNYTITNAVGCTSVASADVVINAQPTTPIKPLVGTIIQPTCTVATGSVHLTGLPAGSWTINPGLITGSTASTTISGLVANTYNYTVTNAAGCTSIASANIVINAQPATPTTPVVGTITQPTCTVATGSVVLSGLPTGNWTINPGSITGSTISTTISSLATGIYNYIVTNAAGCTSVASDDVVINIQPTTPIKPLVGTIIQPTCAVATGSVHLTGLPVGSWTINPGLIAGSTASTIISGLVANTYNYTVTNAAGCTSVASANVVINVQPATPTAPVVGTITQPSCTVATGRVVLSGLPAGNWIINPGAISGTTTSTTISGLSAATYNFTVANTAGCMSVESADVVINEQPLSPVAAGTITGAASVCQGESGIIYTVPVIANATSYIWTLPSGATITTGANTDSITVDFSVSAVGGNITVQGNNKCGTGTISNFVLSVNSLPKITSEPANQEICAGGLAVFSVTATGVGLTYQWRKGTVNLIDDVNISGATSSTLTINTGNISDTATNYNVVITGICSDTSINVSLVVNTAPHIITQPINQTVCVGSPVSFSVTATGTGLTYQWRRGTYNLTEGGYIFGAKSSTLTINPVKFTHAASDYNVVITGICSQDYSNNASLTVDTIPNIIAEPSNQTACVVGCSVSFSVIAIGTDLIYQWRRGETNLINGENISGATSSTLTINPVNISDTASDYNVVVTGTCLEISKSINVSLTICDPTGIAFNYAGNTNKTITIYPNPFTTSIDIMIIDGSNINHCELMIYNMLGVEMIHTTLTKQITTLETNNFPSGIYFYKVIGNNKIIQSGKLISQQ